MKRNSLQRHTKRVKPKKGTEPWWPRHGITEGFITISGSRRYGKSMLSTHIWAENFSEKKK